MTTVAMKILAIDDDPLSAGLLKGWLTREKSFRVEFVWTPTLVEGLRRIADGGVDVVIISLDMQDTRGGKAFAHIREISPVLPIIAITSDRDLSQGRFAIQQGVQEVLHKKTLSGDVLARAIVAALERHQNQKALHSRTFKDEQTGLDNLRFFLSTAANTLELAKRNNSAHSLIIYEMRASIELEVRSQKFLQSSLIVATAQSFRRLLRSSDLTARYGERSFIALAHHSGNQTARAVKDRILQKLRPLEPIGFAGYAVLDPFANMGLAELIEAAEVALLRDKEEKSGKYSQAEEDASLDFVARTSKATTRTTAAVPPILPPRY